MLYKISLAIPFEGKQCLASKMLLFEAQFAIIMIIRQYNLKINLKKNMELGSFMHKHPILTFIKLPFVVKFFVLSIFKWPFYTGFTALHVLFQHFDVNAQLSSGTSYSINQL